MAKSIIKLNLRKLSYSQVLALANSVFAGLTAALGVYTTPFPTLASLTTAITALDAAITAWGPPGNRGSHAQHVALLDARATVELILTQLANYCMDTTPYDEVNLATTGFEIKSVRTPQGVLEMVQNFHNFISRQLNPSEVKLKWKKPLNVAVNGNVKAYKIYRAATADFSTAEIIKTSTKTSYIDTPPAGAMAFNWIVAVNSAGDGVTSDVVQVSVPA